MPDLGYSNRFIILYNPETGPRSVMNPIAVDIYCSVNGSDKTVSELSEELGLPATTVQDIISKMMKEGLLIRFEDKQDSRKTRYHPACNSLLTDTTYYKPVMSGQSSGTDSFGTYRRMSDKGVDMWDFYSMLGLKLEYRADELVSPALDYYADHSNGIRTAADSKMPAEADWKGPFILKLNMSEECDPSVIFEQAVISCALVKSIRNNAEKHFQYRPEIHLDREGRTASIIFYPFETKLGVEEQTQYLMKSDSQNDARKKTVFSLEGNAYIFSNPLMTDILETLCLHDCDMSELTERLGRQKMTVNNALGKLMEIGFVTLKDPLKKRNRIYCTDCVKVLEIDPSIFRNDMAEGDMFWNDSEVEDFGKYLHEASIHLLETAGIRIFE